MFVTSASIPVIWHKKRWLCNDQWFLNETLSAPEYIHYSNEWPEADGAVVSIPARLALDDVAFLNQSISKYNWVLFFVLGDEESLFPIEEIVHPRILKWVMSPVRGRHAPPRFVLNGSQPGLHHIISKCSKQKSVDWFFSGQITHSRRRQCAEQLRKMNNGFLLETPGFMQGLPYEEYLQRMSSAKFVPCPSGPVELSTARIAEALESGCVPIVDGALPIENLRNETRRNAEVGYWEWFFNEVPPFPIIYDWALLPSLIESLLPTWSSLATQCSMWWESYKKFFLCQIQNDIKTLSEKENL